MGPIRISKWLESYLSGGNEHDPAAARESVQISDLLDMGISFDLIAELLDMDIDEASIVQICLEQQDQSPWIRYRLPELDPGSTTSGDLTWITAAICGLAGIVPLANVTPDQWEGAVTFDQNFSQATITYPDFERSASGEPRNVPLIDRYMSTARRLLKVMDRMENLLRSLSLPDNCFIILVRIPERYVKTVAIPLSMFHKLRDMLQWCWVSPKYADKLWSHSSSVLDLFCQADPATSLATSTDRPTTSTSTSKDTAVDKPTTWTSTSKNISTDTSTNGASRLATWPIDLDKSMMGAMDTSCLAVQSLIIGLLSSTNAHIGELHPFFLESGLEEIRLRGIAGSVSNARQLNLSLVELSCIGDMLQSPVLAFSCRQSGPYTNNGSVKFHLSSSANHILKLWGPGEIIQDASGKCCAFGIAGGSINKVPLTSSFHWQRSAVCQAGNKRFAPMEIIKIGGTTETNSCCPTTQRLAGNSTLAVLQTRSQLHQLDTFRENWEETERQGGIQLGQYFTVQYNTTWTKSKTQTIKAAALKGNLSLDVQFLDSPWGLAVSLCTGVAQRVPVRQVVADALIPMSRVWTYKPEGWDTMISCQIEEKLRSDDFSARFNELKPQQRNAVSQVISYVLRKLSFTGLDKDNKMIVACPSMQDPFACSHIPLSNAQVWAKMLKDTDECATFACMTTRCIEAEGHQCRKSQQCYSDDAQIPCWQNEIVLLETAVCQYQYEAGTDWQKIQHRNLEIGKLYMVGDQSKLRAVVRSVKPNVLQIHESIIPYKIWARIPENRRRLIKLQEKRLWHEAHAGDVLVLTTQHHQKAQGQMRGGQK